MDRLEVCEYKYRWLILLFYSMTQIANAVVWITFSPITSVVSDVLTTQAYNMDTIWVELCSMVYMITYIPMVFPSNYILDSWGLRSGVNTTQLTMAAVGTLGAACLRIGGYYSFWYLLFGNILGGLSQPLIMNAPAKLACTWFRSDMVWLTQRPIATTIASVSNPIGVAIGFVLPSIFVDSSSSKTDIGFLMVVEAIFVGICVLPTLILFKNKPANPPSYAAHTEKDTFKLSLHKLMTNKSFLLLLSGFSMGYGSLNAMATLLQQITDPYGYSESDAGMLGALFIVFGIVGSGVAGTVVSKTMKFKCMITGILFTTSCLILGFYPTLEYGSIVYFSILTAITGFILTPIIPIGLELGCEITFPVGEAMNGGILNCSVQIVSIFQILLSSLFDNSTFPVLLILAIPSLIGGVCVSLMKEDLKRSRKDNLNQVATSEKGLINLLESKIESMDS